MDINENVLLMTDSYKVSHYKQYPPGTEHVYSYFESRGGEFDETVFFGLQYYLNRYLAGEVVTHEKIDEAEAIFHSHFGNKDCFNRKGWEHIVTAHQGRLPVTIRAVSEGTVVPTHNVLMTIENTDPACYWLTNYLETLLVQVWYASTVATQSREMKKIILTFLEQTGDPNLIPFKLHDFGFRGVSSVETAAIGGAAHLVNFQGTDTLAGIMLAKKFYNEPMAGFAIPAAEHSTITSWGRKYEADAMKNMLEQFPTGLVAVVSDSFDIYKACSEIWGKQLKEAVLERDGILVVRPDSGDPPKIVCEILELLGTAFGTTTNKKGYRLLHPKIRVIQGDGIDRNMLKKILIAITKNGWSTDNLAFGSGGGLLQKLNRDTSKYAFKCSSITVNGEARDVYKQPITDNGKNSKAGRMKLIKNNNQYETLLNDTVNEIGNKNKDLLTEVFRNGTILKNWTFQEIRKQAVIR